MKGDEIMPMNLMSGTVHSGFNKTVKSFFASDVVIANLHNDVVGKSNDIGMQGPFTNAHVGGLKYRHIDVNRYNANKSVSYVTSVAGTYPTASIEFDVDVLEAKYLLGTSSWVQVRDADGTTVRATYSSVYDVYDNQWRNMDDLVRIFNNKLDITLNKVSDSILNLTQSSTGSSYNYTIQAASHGFITSSGFAGGTNIVETTSTRNLDGPNNRPEGWGLVFKDHPSQGDNDGALGFIGADYGSPYPYSSFLKAEGYREEFAKRPLNIRNIKTSTASAQVGNYKHGQEIFQVQPWHQKTWAKRAYEDSNIDLLPTFDSNNLPNSTHYQTLVTRAPLDKGNVFGQMNNNRQVDTDLGEFYLSINSPNTTTNRYQLASDTSASGYSTTGSKSFSFWMNLDQDFVFSSNRILHLQDGGSTSAMIQLNYDSLYLYLYTTSSYKYFRWNITISDLIGAWKNFVLTWNGDFDSPSTTFYIDSVSQGSPSFTFGTATGSTMRQINRIYIFDSALNNYGYELQGSLFGLGIWETLLTSDDAAEIYNNGRPLRQPIKQSSLIDFYKMELPELQIGSSIPTNTIVNSSFGSGNNHLKTNSGLLVSQGPQKPEIHADLNNVITRPRTDLTGSEHNITTRFSAPGGPEVQSIGYLDAYSQTYSTHNAMPFRNLSVLGSGSGEQGTIRVTDHLGLRRGLRTLRALHMGKFGIDSNYGEINSSNYEASASYNKQHRNRSRRMEYSGTSIITGSNYDNDFINTPIPRSELQYSWIKAATSGSDAPTQNILGYAPKDGIISSSAGWVAALVFPTASSIFED